MSEELQNEVTEEVTEEQTQEETPKPDKPVEQSQFNRYRDAYLREQLTEMKIKEGAEMTTALKFIDDRADDMDGNLDELFRDLKVRMRLEERIKPAYVDPSPMNGAKDRPRHADKTQIGTEAFSRVKHKLGGRLL